MSKSVKFPLLTALTVAHALVEKLEPWCARIEVVGSIRRRKPEVSDAEVLYIPNRVKIIGDPDVNEIIQKMLHRGELRPRLNTLGRPTMGEQIKLVTHVASGLPIDLFATTHDNWFNYLVCRTGPAELNQRIATRAIEKGWKWHPTESGFSNERDDAYEHMKSEEDVFRFVGLNPLKPEER